MCELDIAGGRLSLMTHVVAGYPDLESSLELAVAMADSGSDMIEVQIPFSDPLADGPVIMKANQVALDAGMTPVQALEMVRELRVSTGIPVFVMTYANIPYSMGLKRFVTMALEADVNGLIIPDIPFDSSLQEFFKLVSEHRLNNIYVVSPDMEPGRLRDAIGSSSGFVYTTLRVGITGADRGNISTKGLEFVRTVKRYTTLPVAAGFGISSPEQFRSLEGIADIGVIGSKLIKIYDTSGAHGVEKFVKRCVSDHL